MESGNQYLMQTYVRSPVSFERGHGSWLWDTEGNSYLDALGGVAVAILGHAHPKVAEAIADQARTLLHTSNLYDIPLQRLLGERLCRLSGMDRAFFCNSGAEANEAAIKIARRFGHQKGIDKPAILVTDGAFHGRTLATLSATGNRKAQAGFEPLVAGFKRVPFNDLASVRQLGHGAQDVVGVFVEPIQGEGGIHIPDAGYLSGLREVCDANDWLLMVDEIQTGMCRTGKWFAYQHEGISPDVATVAKALGNGIPIGACLARGRAAEVLVPGSHGSTFGGNPFACRVGLTVLDLLEQDRLAERAAVLGARILDALQQRLSGFNSVRAIRGRGLMIGVEFSRPCTELVSIALKERILVNVTAGTVLRLLPPLIFTDEEAEMLVEGVVAAIERFEKDRTQ
jgi:acetylornithine aminotransferase